MKRFFAALALLAVTIFIAVYLNSKTLSLAEEFIDIIDSDCSTAQLRDAWEEKSKLFTVLLPHEQVEDIETIIESLEPISESSDEIYQSERAKLKYKMEVLKESMQVNTENIF